MTMMIRGQGAGRGSAPEQPASFFGGVISGFFGGHANQPHPHGRTKWGPRAVKTETGCPVPEEMQCSRRRAQQNCKWVQQELQALHSAKQQHSMKVSKAGKDQLARLWHSTTGTSLQCSFSFFTRVSVALTLHGQDRVGVSGVGRNCRERHENIQTYALSLHALRNKVVLVPRKSERTSHLYSVPCPSATTWFPVAD
jgi:hypothetical protein